MNISTSNRQLTIQRDIKYCCIKDKILSFSKILLKLKWKTYILKRRVSSHGLFFFVWLVFFYIAVLNCCHTYGPCPPSPLNKGQPRKVILSPGVNLCWSALCRDAVLGWDVFRCRDDRRKNNEAAEYVWRVAESSYHHVFV